MAGSFFDPSWTLTTYPMFKTLFLAHNQDVNEKRREFTLDDLHALYHKFRRCGTYPYEFTGNTITLSSLTDGLVVVVYANEDAGSYFAVGLGYHLGQGWVHVVCDEHQEVHSWQSFGKSAYYRVWGARAEHARNMSKLRGTHLTRDTHFVKHAHLSRSIWAARVVWGRWELNNFRVMVDVEHCPGCCDGPCRMATRLNDWGSLDMPGLMNTTRRTYSLKLDGWLAEVDRCSGQRNSLGDYGDYVDGILIRTGNIFDDMRSLGIDPELPAYCPLVSRVSSDTRSEYYKTDQAGVTIAYHITGDARPALRQGRGISLPANERFVLLLKAFSTRLAGKHLVTTIVQCSDFYNVDREGNRMDSGDDIAPDSGMHDAERILTPFCAIASPQVWRREPPCVRRIEQFERIR
ncbi:hypothetical protein EDD15DRAFT_347117 [Pisolithus albus]|nr:hypothetical protein EDD15DRAFT_347117 [Pisolithus albus]